MTPADARDDVDAVPGHAGGDHGASDGAGSDGGRDGHHGYGHGADVGTDEARRLAIVAAINVVGFLVEFAGGLVFGSLALLSDAFHMLFDALAYVMAFAAAVLATHYGDGDSWSYGLHRLEPLAAFVNGVLLLPMVGFILWESYQRWLAPVAIAPVPTLAIALGGLAVNAGSVLILHRDEMTLNERGAYYHLIGDAGGSVAVIVSTVVVATTGIQVVDPVAAILIGVVVTWSAVKVLLGSGAIFLHRMPLDGDAVRERLETIEGVARVADFHAWEVCSEITIATTHVETSAEAIDDAERVTREVHDALAALGVQHATVEVCRDYDAKHTHLDRHHH